MPKFVDEIGKAVVARIPAQLAKNSKSSGIANGNLAKSFSYSIQQTQNGVQISIDSTADYAEYADTGRKPGKPAPFTPIYQWVQKYKIAPVKAMEVNKARQMAYLIGRNGTKPLNYLQPAVEFVWNTRKDLWVDAGKEIVLDKINKIIP